MGDTGETTPIIAASIRSGGAQLQSAAPKWPFPGSPRLIVDALAPPAVHRSGWRQLHYWNLPVGSLLIVAIGGIALKNFVPDWSPLRVTERACPIALARQRDFDLDVGISSEVHIPRRGPVTPTIGRHDIKTIALLIVPERLGYITAAFAAVSSEDADAAVEGSEATVKR